MILNVLSGALGKPQFQDVTIMNVSITAILAGRKPLVGIARTLNMTVAGIVAHQPA